MEKKFGTIFTRRRIKARTMPDSSRWLLLTVFAIRVFLVLKIAATKMMGMNAKTTKANFQLKTKPMTRPLITADKA
jgi:hypothetical protein